MHRCVDHTDAQCLHPRDADGVPLANGVTLADAHAPGDVPTGGRDRHHQ
jgi:hypothetical protein